MPSWMKILVEGDVIQIEGTPKYSDIGKLLVKVSDRYDFVIK